MKCVAPQDVLVVMDASSKVKAEDFDHVKGLAKRLVEQSTFRGDGELLRYALLLFGAARPKLLSQMSGDQNKLLETIEAATYGGGYSNVAEAMSTAVQVSQLATAGERPLRRETLVLVTGNPLRKNAATTTAARRLRAVGIRIVVVQVGHFNKPNVMGDESVCRIASTPCADNWLRVNSWDELANRDIGYFVSTICPLKEA